MQRKVCRTSSWLAVLTLLVAMVAVCGRPRVSALAPEDAWNVEFVGQIGGGSLAVAVQGDYAYLGAGPRLAVVDVSDPTQPGFLT